MTYRPATYRLEPLTAAQARDILGWQYPEPYDFYNPPPLLRPDEDYIREFLNPEYQFHAVLSEQADFVGFCSFGLDGQVPGGTYDDSALDIGLGMRPELTGQGRGASFFHAIMNYATERFEASALRLTVACFNTRAIRLYEQFGFRTERTFQEPASWVDFQIMRRDLQQ
ncbi:MAG: GNAT family N-acetyltransferase [Pseudomonadales bacterium]|nr:GNAT family N-acetyltransferase [Pseudomonadales bacterium]